MLYRTVLSVSSERETLQEISEVGTKNGGAILRVEIESSYFFNIDLTHRRYTKNCFLILATFYLPNFLFNCASIRIEFLYLLFSIGLEHHWLNVNRLFSSALIGFPFLLTLVVGSIFSGYSQSFPVISQAGCEVSLPFLSALSVSVSSVELQPLPVVLTVISDLFNSSMSC